MGKGLTLMTFLLGVAMAIEKPDYTVIKKYDDFEIRSYNAYLVAETKVDTGFDDATNIAFRRLFDYISGENVKAEKIKMTSPVSQKEVDKKGEKISMTAPVSQRKMNNGEEAFLVNFLVPTKYTLATVPKPKDSRVSIREIPGKMMAARRYSGNWSQEKYKQNEQKLLASLKKENIEPIGAPVFARYNPPFWPAFLRRNEILIEIDYQPE